MKIKNIITLLFISLCFVPVYSKDTECFYYYKGEKQYLKQDKTKLNITTSKKSTFFNKKNVYCIKILQNNIILHR